MKNSMHGLQLRLLVIAFAAVVLPSAAYAQSYTGSETLSDFGFLSQYNSGVTYSSALNVQPVACAPTAFANGLTFLNNVNGGTVFTNSPNSYGSVNALAQAMSTKYNTYYNSTTGKNYNTGGTVYYNAALGALGYGLNTGFNPSLTQIKVGGEFTLNNTAGRGLGANFNSTVPTAGYLNDALVANSAVELGLEWGDLNSATGSFTDANSGHVITLVGLNLNNGSGTAQIIDPISAAETLNDPSATADVLTVDVSTVDYAGSNFLALSYPDFTTIVGGQEPETGGPDPATNNDFAFGGASGQFALVDSVWTESVPEPSAWALGVISLAAVFGLRVRVGRRAF